MTGRTIADHADYRITLHQASDRPTEKLIVTFGGQPSGLAAKGFGTDYLHGLGHDSLYVAQRHGTQYQGLSVEEFQAHVAELAEGRDVICYGSSLGAYAALYYGGSIDARIIAAAPMLPAWRPLRNRVYAGLEVQHRDLSEVPRSRHKPVAIYDPMMRADVKVIEEMVRPAYPDLRELRLPYAGHTVLITLAHARHLKAVIGALLDRDELLDVSMPTDGFAIWHYQRGRHLRTTDLPQARAEIERSLALQPTKQAVAELLRILVALRDLPAAQALLDSAGASDSPQMKLIPSAVAFAQRAGLRVSA